MGYTKEAIKGVGWVGAGHWFARGLALTRIPILARFLLPSQFGIFGIAGLLLAFVEILSETGINVFLIQQKGNVDRYLPTAWIISIVRGFLIAVIIFLTTPFVVFFFNAPQAQELLWLIATVPLIRGFINPSVVKFQKELAFDREFWFKSAVLLVESTIAVVLVIITREPISLVWALVASGIVEVVLSFFVAKPLPHFAFEVSLAKQILTRGKWVTVYGIFNYVFEHGDDTVVGRLIGVSPLGVYQMAYKLSTLPITEVTQVVGRVTFPVYTNIAGDTNRLGRAFLATTGVIAMLTIPFGLLLFLFPQPVVSILLGSSWLAASEVLGILAIFGVVRAITSSVFILFLSLNKQEWVTVSTLVSAVVLAISIVPLTMRFGIVGAGLSALAGQLAAVPLVSYYTAKSLRKVK